MNFKIYKITNKINQKIYFGYTKQILRNRFYGHCSESKNTYISKSIRKYGRENFDVELIMECDNKEDAAFMEKFLIFRYKTNVKKFPIGNGMNLSDGGESIGYDPSTEVLNKSKKKVYQFDLDGNFINEYESIKSASKVFKTRAIGGCCRKEFNTCKGFIFQFNKIFEPRNLENPNNKKVYQFDLNGNLIAEFKSAKDACEFINTDGVTKCCKRKILTCGGFIFQYDKKFKARDLRNPRNKKVYQFDLDGNLIDDHDSAKIAGMQLGINPRKISRNCNKKTKPINGFIFRY
jgi:group I intron endonuclease